MRYFFPFLVTTLILFSCGPNYGSLNGNAYWKYNDYVGDKPDPGTEVYLFPWDSSKEVYETTCDVQGNFMFDKIVTGDYILVAISKNTTASSIDQFYELASSAAFIYLDFWREKSDRALFNRAWNKHTQYVLKEISVYEANSVADSLLLKIPEKNRLLQKVSSFWDII
jgi:hypothetical protein